jgi:hypothetical protein
MPFGGYTSHHSRDILPQHREVGYTSTFCPENKQGRRRGLRTSEYLMEIEFPPIVPLTGTFDPGYHPATAEGRAPTATVKSIDSEEIMDQATGDSL